MSSPLYFPRLSSVVWPLAAALSFTLAACGGGEPDADPTVAGAQAAPAQDGHATIAALTRQASTTGVATTNTLHVGISVPGYPHKVDVYRPAGATKAIVFLHGLGGRSWQVANDLGLNLKAMPPTASTVNWDWLSRNGVIAVFPQAMNAPGTTTPTWSNYIQDSGQDDVGFLKALSAYVSTQYGATAVSLSGHSNGGAMTARIWCEATTSYKAYVTLAGPMPSATYPVPSATCTPLVPAPYYAVVGGKDTKLALFSAGVVTPTPEQQAAGITDSILLSEWNRHVDRSQRVCSEAPLVGDRSVAAYGPTWNACSNRVRYTVVSNADHPIASLQQYTGAKMVDWIAAFVN